jgi:endoglucanase
MLCPGDEASTQAAADLTKSSRSLRRDEGAGRGATRREALKSLAAAGAAVTLSPVLARSAQNPAAKPPYPTLAGGNPRWYGFNLLEYFSTDPDWMKYFPYKDDGLFREDDFRWIHEWGFNFVRLPMDYRFWTAPSGLKKIDERKVEPIDRAIRLGEKYQVHVNICLHRAPGYCILDGMDAALTGIHVTPERTNLYTDSAALEAFVHQWTFFARRYQGMPSERLSFNLVNEPVLRLTGAERAALAAKLKLSSPPAIDRAIEEQGEKEYARVARVAIHAIRSIDPQRLIVSDGCASAIGWGPVPDLIGTGVLQSPHDYSPTQVTHYKTEWAPGVKQTEPPAWPLRDQQGKVLADRQTIEHLLRPWRGMEQRGVRIHFGEMGCNKRVPHQTVLAWFNDSLDAIGELRSGWALWNFRGPFGILDTQRADTKFEDWHGHQLDRQLLALLQAKMQPRSA